MESRLRSFSFPFALLGGVGVLAGCGNYSMERFERLCRTEGKITVHDREGWSQYLSVLHRFAQLNDWDEVVISPIEGYSYESDVTRGKAEVQKRRPFRDDVYIGKDRKPLATIANFMVYQGGFDGGGEVDCTGLYPEIYLPQSEANGQ